MPRVKTLKTCSFCAKKVYKIAGHGLCAACYYREQRNGAPEYVKVRKRCSVDGCEDLSRSQGYCGKHLSRFKKHGVAEGMRFDKWGHASTHPLANSYYHMRRHYDVDQGWLDDFWQFVADVGDRPSPRHKLFRVRHDRPYGPGNVSWRAASVERLGPGRESANEYARIYRAANPEIYRGQHLRKKYGKDLAWFNQTMEDQLGVCAICRGAETAKDRNTGLPRSMAVDHCHASGNVRGILCSKCNTGLGAFKDNPDILRAAIAYLEKHALPPSPE